MIRNFFLYLIEKKIGIRRSAVIRKMYLSISGLYFGPLQIIELRV